HDKLCDFSDGDGIVCSRWASGIVHLGYKTTAGFVQARSIVLKKSSGQTTEVSPAASLLRIARMPQVPGSTSSNDRLAVFYLVHDVLRRKRVMSLEAFSDRVSHGSLVIRLDRPDGTTTELDLDSVGDFVRRGA